MVKTMLHRGYMKNTIIYAMLCIAIGSITAGEQMYKSLYSAIEQSNIKIINQLFEQYKNDIDAQDCFNVACDACKKHFSEEMSKKHAKVLQIFVKAGANVNQANIQGNTQLHLATGYTRAAHMIGKRTAKEYQDFKSKEYPLANVPLVQCLVSVSTIDPLLKNNDGDTALDQAQMLQCMFSDDESISQIIPMLEKAIQKRNDEKCILS